MSGLQPVLEKLERLLERAEGLLERLDADPSSDDMAAFRTAFAFRWERRGEGGRIVPVHHPHLFDLSDLLGVEYPVETLLRNTEQFVRGLPANNVLLWGERGTGKSSCIKGLITPFAPRGLRLLEVQRTDLLSLPAVVSRIRGLPFRFILFCDDLSFSETDTSYHELKTLLDGGVEERPSNMLIYATSNRRHLMPEPMSENTGGEIHPEEAVSDRISLADRFGITLGFYPFDQDTYLSIARRYLEKEGISWSEERRMEALRWAMYRGQRSGRAARQFADDAAGRLRLSDASM